MKNPYLIEEVANISFSGGRSSAYMTARVLEAHGGLPEHIKITFCNTGKEMPQTLDFVRDCGLAWGVHIVWLECRARRGGEGENRYVYETVEVDYETASRNGEPFASVIEARKYLPNPVARFCTQELKINRMRDYMKRFGDFVNVVGIRADEPRRIGSLRKSGCLLPLVDAGVSKMCVADYWRKQGHDLRLPNNNGVTDWGNCDLCFLKGFGKKMSIIEHKPELALWWAEQEEKRAATFRKDEPSYRNMIGLAGQQLGMFDYDSLGCFCCD